MSSGGTPGKPRTYAAFAECASLTTAILAESYPGWATTDFFTRYLGSASPLARDYEQHLAAGTVPHFTTVAGPASLRPGDVIAADDRNGADQNSGHVATVRTAPVRTATFDHDSGRAWVVPVLDSTDTPHGSPGGEHYDRYPDTRWDSGSTHPTGAGYGYLLLYAGPHGAFAGYRWSVTDPAFHDTGERPLTAARIAA